MDVTGERSFFDDLLYLSCFKKKLKWKKRI